MVATSFAVRLFPSLYGYMRFIVLNNGQSILISCSALWCCAYGATPEALHRSLIEGLGKKVLMCVLFFFILFLCLLLTKHCAQMKSEFGKTLKEQREKKGYGLRELARRVGISPGYLSQLENGNALGLPSEETIIELAKALSYDKTKLILLADKLPKDIELMVKDEMKQGDLTADDLIFLFRKRKK